MAFNLNKYFIEVLTDSEKAAFEESLLTNRNKSIEQYSEVKSFRSFHHFLSSAFSWDKSIKGAMYWVHLAHTDKRPEIGKLMTALDHNMASVNNEIADLQQKIVELRKKNKLIQKEINFLQENIELFYEA